MQQFQPLTILEQKFRFPEQRVKLTIRQQLLTQLAVNKDASLMTIVSPAGYGKSTLMAQYLKQLKQDTKNQVIWISLDASDNEPNQFFSLLCHALVFVNLADKSLIARANNSSAKTDQVVFSQGLLKIIEESSSQIYMCFDDFHYISDPIIVEFFNRLIHYCPKQLHVIITSRIQPKIELSPLYAQGLLYSLAAEDLKFTLAEAQCLLADNINKQQVATIYQETEGWPVALQLLRLWYQQNPNKILTNALTSNIDTLTRYMSEQILNKFDLQTQNFLLKTSFLDRFDIELANYICEIDHGTQIISNINEHQSLIISQDDSNTSFRYHHLFSDFLQQTFIATYGEAQCNSLRCKAALWFTNKDHLSEAVNQYVRAKNITLAIQLIADAGSWEMIMTKGTGYVESLLSHFTRKDITNSPTLGLLQCYLYLKLGQVIEADEQFNIAEVIQHDNVNSDIDENSIHRDFLILDILLKTYLDHLMKIDPFKKTTEIMQTLTVSDHIGRGTLLALETLTYNQYGQFKLAETKAIECSREMRLANCWVGINYITLHHGQSLAYRGHLEAAMSQFNIANQLAQEYLGIDSGLQSMSKCLTAEIHYQKRELEQAEALLEQGITALELRDAWYDIYAVTFKLAINLALTKNDKVACENYIYRGHQVVLQRKLWRLGMLLDVLSLKIALHFDDTTTFSQLNNKIIREKFWTEELHLWMAKSEYHAIQAICFLRNNSSTKALFHADKILKLCEKKQQIIEMSKAKIIQSLAYFSVNNEDKAFNLLLEVVQNCTQYKIKQVFFEVLESVENLLVKFKQHANYLLITGDESSFINGILDDFKNDVEDNLSQLGLSHREQQLIPLLTQGQSNKKMSISLGISENTVKFHLKNLFSKINVKNRNEATLFFINL